MAIDRKINKVKINVGKKFEMEPLGINKRYWIKVIKIRLIRIELLFLTKFSKNLKHTINKDKTIIDTGNPKSI